MSCREARKVVRSSTATTWERTVSRISTARASASAGAAPAQPQAAPAQDQPAPAATKE